MDEAAENEVLKSAVVKTLAVIGFLTIIGLLVYLCIMAVSRAPEAFSSLASVAEHINSYRPHPELTVATQGTVVNSHESFQMSWTNLRTPGEYTLSYSCISGVTLEVPQAAGAAVPVRCDEAFRIPTETYDLSLSLISDELRFVDVPIAITFTPTDSEQVATQTITMTVVNAHVAVGNTTQDKNKNTDTTNTPVADPSTPTPSEDQVRKNGDPDLAVTILGAGTIVDTVFRYSQTYAAGAYNALRFDVKNTGTVRSAGWTFSVTLPSGEVYRSTPQNPLGPGEHVESTLGFFFTGGETDPATISVTIYPGSSDALYTNNAATSRVPVR